MDSIPRTVSGKVQRGKLAGMDDRRDALTGLLGRLKDKGWASCLVVYGCFLRIGLCRLGSLSVTEGIVLEKCIP